MKKSGFLLSIKILLLVLIFTLSFILGTIFSGLSNMQEPAESSEGGGSMLFLLLNSIVTVGLLTWVTLKSRWSFIFTSLSLFTILFLIGSLLPQFDTLFFSTNMEISVGTGITIIISGLISALLYIPISIWMLRKHRIYPAEAFELPVPPVAPTLLLALLYLVVYFIFGYFIAWQSADLRAFYSGSTAILPFWEHMQMTFRGDPGLLVLQLFRGLLWVGLAWLIIHLIRAGRPERMLITALLFSLIGILLLLIPNPFMPEVVRKVHFVEVLSSNFLFGLFTSWILLRTNHSKKPRFNPQVENS